MGYEIKISVRNLVEFLLRSGDLDDRGGGSPEDAMVRGALMHRKLQGAQGAEYASEVSLKAAWVLPDTFEKLIEAFGSGHWGLVSPLQMKPDLENPDKRFKRHYHGTMISVPRSTSAIAS